MRDQWLLSSRSRIFPQLHQNLQRGREHFIKLSLTPFADIPRVMTSRRADTGCCRIPARRSFEKRSSPSTQPCAWKRTAVLASEILTRTGCVMPSSQIYGALVRAYTSLFILATLTPLLQNHSFLCEIGECDRTGAPLKSKYGWKPRHRVRSVYAAAPEKRTGARSLSLAKIITAKTALVGGPARVISHRSDGLISRTLLAPERGTKRWKMNSFPLSRSLLMIDSLNSFFLFFFQRHVL